MNQIKLVLSSLAFVVLAACGAKSDSNSADAEFLKVSAELKQTLPEVDDSLSSQSPEGIWRIASHSLLYFSHEIEQISEVWDESSESYNQLLIVIKKDDSAENSYVIYTCDSHWGNKSWRFNVDKLSYSVKSDNGFSYVEESGDLVLDNNLSLVGEIAYKKNNSSYGSIKNTIYTGVKISDAVDFHEAIKLNIELEVSRKDTLYRLSENQLTPICFSIYQSEVVREKYTPATDLSEIHNENSSSFLIQMMDGNRVGADEKTTVINRTASRDFTRYYPDIGELDFQLTFCPDNSGIADRKCLKTFVMASSADANGMSASSKGESLAGETFEIFFSYAQE